MRSISFWEEKLHKALDEHSDLIFLARFTNRRAPKRISGFKYELRNAEYGYTHKYNRRQKRYARRRFFRPARLVRHPVFNFRSRRRFDNDYKHWLIWRTKAAAAKEKLPRLSNRIKYIEAQIERLKANAQG